METKMNSLIEDLKGRAERATLRGSNISLFPETALALVEEIKRLRTELATMKAAAAPAVDEYTVYDWGSGTWVKPEVEDTPATEAPAAAEATSDDIKVGDVVVVTHSMTEDDTEFVGKVGAVTLITNAAIFQHIVKFRHTSYRMDKSQIKRLE
jgi:hypothetical protein